jgi:hypothetical protein
MLGTGSVLRTHVEYANTKAKWYQATDNYEIAYTQGIFHEGYRYRGRNIGHTTDGDSETTSVMLSLTTGNGNRWAALLRRGRLDICCTPGANSRISNGPSRYRSGQLSWEGSVHDHGLSMQLGYEEQTPSSSGSADGLFGFVQWRKRFDTK